MESINFNDYSTEERMQIIKAFLEKTRTEGAMGNAHNFFNYYFQKFYKIPGTLLNDIIYCQRAMRAHLQVHQLVVQVYAQQADADPVQKEKFLREIEEQLCEINAESNYLTLVMKDDIKKFCQVFYDFGFDCNDKLTYEVVSHQIIPKVVNLSQIFHPINVLKRETEEELIKRYFMVANDENTIKDNQHIIDIVDITSDDDVGNKDSIAVVDQPTTVQTAESVTAKPKSTTMPTKSKQRRKTSVMDPPAATSAVLADQKTSKINVRRKTSHEILGLGKAGDAMQIVMEEPKIQPQKKFIRNRKQVLPVSSKVMLDKIVNPLPTVSTSFDIDQSVILDSIEASRRNFLQVLKRKRNEQLKHSAEHKKKSKAPDSVVLESQTKSQKTQPTVTTGATVKISKNATGTAAAGVSGHQSGVNKTPAIKYPSNEMEAFLYKLGLCTHSEFKRKFDVSIQQKRRSYNKTEHLNTDLF